MRIERVRPEQFDDVIALWEAAKLVRPWNEPREDLRRALDGPASVVLVGLDGGPVVASVMVGHDGHRGWIYYLAVAADVRRQGRGRMMMAAAEAWLRDRGVPKLNLMVRGENRAVHDFYRSIGYDSDDVVVFSRRLGQPP